MKCVNADIGIKTADAQNVAIQFARSDLTLTFIDWKQQSCKVMFSEVLAFRWQEFDEQDLRDDASYEVVGSEWLKRQTMLQAVHPDDFAHYKLGFNASGCLDVLVRRSGIVKVEPACSE